MSGGTILVAEDSAVIRALLRVQLAEQGYRVVEAADGVEALDRCREAKPDVILLDVEMPRLDGFGALAELKADPSLESIPVVFITARVTAEHAAEGLRRGAHDYLRKPFEAAELAARVHAAMRTKALQDELLMRNLALEELTRTDALTGLANRRELDEQLHSLRSSAARHGRRLSVVMLDVDRFKSVNDTHGHAAGDAVLVEIAHRLKARTRVEDILGRWGGEEFLVLLPDTDEQGAERFAESARTLIAAEPIVCGETTIAVSASFGRATWSGEGIEELVRRADAALYAAKEAGRNLVRPG